MRQKNKLYFYHQFYGRRGVLRQQPLCITLSAKRNCVYIYRQVAARMYTQCSHCYFYEGNRPETWVIYNSSKIMTHVREINIYTIYHFSSINITVNIFQLYHSENILITVVPKVIIFTNPSKDLKLVLYSLLTIFRFPFIPTPYFAYKVLTYTRYSFIFKLLCYNKHLTHCMYT